MLTWLFKLVWWFERLHNDREVVYVTRPTLDKYKAQRSYDA